MNTFIVIGITGEHFTITADDYRHNPEEGRLLFIKDRKYIAIFELNNIIGFYME